MASPRGRYHPPSRDGGTNALLLSRARRYPSLGRDSFQRHRRLAEEAGIPVRVIESDPCSST